MFDSNFFITILVLIAILYLYLRSPRKPPTVVDLICYPIKSCPGIHLSKGEVTITGLQDDRRWAIIQDSRPLTQLNDQKLIKLQPSFKYNSDNKQTHLVLSFPGFPDYSLELNNKSDPKDFSVEQVTGQYTDEGDSVAEWLLSVFGKNYRLGRIVKSRNFSELKYYTGDPIDAKLSFAGEGQFLVVSEEDLEKLKEVSPANVKSKIRMECYRPNIVLKHLKAFEEDNWDEFYINDVRMKGTKRCDRCRMTTIDHETLEFEPACEPLNTLRKINGDKGMAFFGLITVQLNPGTIKLGDTVRVISKIKR